MSRTALVLSGGGARGAYQAGVIKALEEILRSKEGFPFDIVCGVSAGSINASALASSAQDFTKAAGELERLWGNLTADQVIKTDIRSLSKIGANWIRDLSFGGAVGAGHAQALLDTEPLRELLSKNFDSEQVDKNIKARHLYALAISATNIYTNNSVTFVQGHENLSLWGRHKRVSERTQIRVDHLMASSAIPVFFPSIEVEGRHFTDGCIGNIAPLSPAIHLGAGRILAVGVRNVEMESETIQGPRGVPSIANVIGLLMNTVFMDSIEVDIARLKRINEITSLGQTLEGGHHYWRPVEVLLISPSEKIHLLAREYTKNLPRAVRYLLRGLGDQNSTDEIASYLLFDTSFCSRLIEMGYNDTLRERIKIEKMFT